MKDLIERLRNDTLDDISDTALEAADALERLTAGDVALPKAQWLGDIPGFTAAQIKDYGDQRAAAAVLAERERLVDLLETENSRKVLYTPDCIEIVRKGTP